MIARAVAMLAVATAVAGAGTAPADVSLAEVEPPSLELAYRLLHGGELQRAEATLRELVARDPRDLAAREGLVWVAMAAGDMERAARLADERLERAGTGDGWHDQWLHAINHAPSRRGQARAAYGARLGADPADVASALGWAALERRHARPDAAREVLRRSLRWRPDRAAAWLALADVDLAGGRFGAALRHVREAESREPAHPGVASVRLAVERATLPTVRLKTTWSEESTGFRRLVVQAPAEVWPTPDLRLRVGLEHARFRDASDALERESAALELRWRLPGGIHARGGWRGTRAAGSDLVHDHVVELDVQPGDGPWRFRLGHRRRSVLDPPVGHEDLAHLEGIGSGGGSMTALRRGTQVSEACAVLTWVPREGVFAYAEADWGQVDDGNGRRLVAVGSGMSLAPRRGPLRGHVLVLRHDAFRLTTDKSAADYWSPDSFEVHSLGAQWHWQPRPGWVLGADVATSLRRRAHAGWSGGVVFRFPLGERHAIEGRWRAFDDTSFAVQAATLSLVVRP